MTPDTGTYFEIVRQGRDDRGYLGSSRARQELLDVIDRTISGVFDVETDHLHLATRGDRRVSTARQVGMYVAHVGFGLTLTEVGRMFNRDRTTVAHACTMVEQRRDDASFSEAVDLLELVIRVLVGPDGRGGAPVS